MTPKEKAKELVDRFYQTTPYESLYNRPLASISLEYTSWGQAKECALIAVDEILKDQIGNDATIGNKSWWLWQVKLELERL